MPLFSGNSKLINDWQKWSDKCKKKNIVAELTKIPPFLDITKLNIKIFDELHKVSKTCALLIKSNENQVFFNKKTRYIINKAARELIYRKANKSDLKLIHDLYISSMVNLNADKRFYLDLKAFKFLLEEAKSTFHLAFYEEQLVGFVCFYLMKKFLIIISQQIIYKEDILMLIIFCYQKLLKSQFYVELKWYILVEVLPVKKMIHYLDLKKFSNFLLDYNLGLSIYNKKSLKNIEIFSQTRL